MSRVDTATTNFSQSDPDDAAAINPLETPLGRRLRYLQRLKAFPVVVDLLEDRVHARSLTVVVFSVLFLLVLRQVMVGLFLFTPPQFIAPVPITLQARTSLTLSSASAQQLNRDIFPVVGAMALSAYGEGVPNVTVAASVGLQKGLILNEVYDLMGTLVSMGGVMYEEVLSLPSIVPEKLIPPRVTGHLALTDAEGAAVFRSLRVDSGLPGVYSIKFAAPKHSLVTASEILLHVRSDVGAVMLVSTPPSHSWVDVGEPVPVSVRVLDQAGQPMRGKRVTAFAQDREVFTTVFPFLTGSFLHPQFALLENDTSTLTDADGVADLHVSVAASAMPTVLLRFSCDGWTANETFAFNVRTRVHTVQIVRQPADNVTEGQPLAAQPAVRLLDSAGRPVPGARALAYLGAERGTQVRYALGPEAASSLNGFFRGASDHYWFLRAKHLRNPLSAPADEHGVATFHDLGFTACGPAGDYQLVFYSTGAISRNSITVRVDTAVARVEVALAPQTVAVHSGAHAAGYLVDSNEYEYTPPAVPSGSLLQPPTLRVLAADGRPLAGKWAVAVVEGEREQGPYVLEEFPAAGTARSGPDGAITYVDRSPSTAANDQLLRSCQISRCHAHWRMLAGRNGTALVRFLVDGVASAAVPLQVANLDPAHSAPLALAEESEVLLPDLPHAHSAPLARAAPLALAAEAPPAAIAHAPSSWLPPARWLHNSLQGAGEADSCRAAAAAARAAARSPARSLAAQSTVPHPLPSVRRCSYIEILEQPSVVVVSPTIPIAPVRVRALDTYGQPVRNISVLAFVHSTAGALRYGPQESGVYPLYHPAWMTAIFGRNFPAVSLSPLEKRPAENPYSGMPNTEPVYLPPMQAAVTDEQGVAVFDNITISAGFDTFLRLYFSHMHFAAFNGSAGSPRLEAAPRYMCNSAIGRPISLRNPYRVQLLQSPAGCELGAPLREPLRARVRRYKAVAALATSPHPLGAEEEADAGAWEAAPGVRVDAGIAMDFDRARTFPSYLPIQVVDMLSLPLGDLVPVYGVVWGRGIASGMHYAVTDALGEATFNITFLHGHPGNFTLLVLANGQVSTPASPVSCPNPVGALDVTDIAPEACDPSLEVDSAGRSPVCPTDALGQACSGHGQCRCGVCMCELPWMADAACSGAVAQHTLAALAYAPLPIVQLRRFVPSWLLGRVRVLDSAGQPLAGYRVEAMLALCSTRLLVREPLFGFRECTADGFPDVIFSAKSDADGYASFSPRHTIARSHLRFYESENNCYQFLFRFYGTSPRAALTQAELQPLQGAVLGQALSRPFAIFNPLRDYSLRRVPSAVAALGVPLLVQPQLQLQSMDNATLVEDACMRFARSGSLLCPDNAGTVVRARAINVRTQQYVELQTMRDIVDCARSDATGHVTFTNLMFPTHYISLSKNGLPSLVAMPVGEYVLEYRAEGQRGVDTRTRIRIETDASALQLLAGLPASATVHGAPLPPLSVRATISDGSLLPGLRVVLLLRDAGATDARSVAARRRPGRADLAGSVMVQQGAGGASRALDDSAELAAAVTDMAGEATFSGLRFAAGEPGSYALMVRSTAVEEGVPAADVEVHGQLVLRNAVEEVGVRLTGSTKEPVIALSTAPFGFIVCARGSDGSGAGAGLRVVPHLFARAAPAGEGAPASNATYLAAPDIAVNLAPRMTDAQGCVQWAEFAITRLPRTTNISISFSVSGVMSPATHITAQDQADANPWSFQRLIQTALLGSVAAVPVLLANTLFVSRPAHRRLLLVLGVLCTLLTAVQLVLFWENYADLRHYFPSSATKHVLALTLLYAAASAAVAALAAAVCCSGCRTMRRRRGAQAPSLVHAAGWRDSFFRGKALAYTQYVRHEVPSLARPLLEEGRLAPDVREVLLEFFSRFRAADPQGRADVINLALRRAHARARGAPRLPLPAAARSAGMDAAGADAAAEQRPGSARGPTGVAAYTVNPLSHAAAAAAGTALAADEVPQVPVAIVTDGTAGGGQEAGQRFAAWYERRLQEVCSPLVTPDCGVWSELREFGYDHTLRLQLVDGAGVLSPWGRVVLQRELMAFRALQERSRGRRLLDAAAALVGVDLPLRRRQVGGSARGAQRVWWTAAQRQAEVATDGLSYEESLAFLRASRQQPVSRATFSRVCGAAQRLDADALARLVALRSRKPQAALQQALAALGCDARMNFVGARAQQRPPSPVFLPQRLLVALVLSLCSCAFAFSLTDTLMLRAAAGVDWLVDGVVRDEARGVLAAAQLSMEQQGRVRDHVFRAAQRGDSGDASQLLWTLSSVPEPGVDTTGVLLLQPRDADALVTPHTVWSNAGNALTGGVTAASTSPSVADDAAAPEGDMLGQPWQWLQAQVLQDADVALLMASPVKRDVIEYKEAIKAHVQGASTVAASIAYATVLLMWWLQIATFARRVRAGRRGELAMVWSKTPVPAAVNFVGLQAATSAIGFFFFWLPWTVVVTALMWQRSRDLIFDAVLTNLSRLLGASLVIMIIQWLLMNKLLATKHTILHRRLFMLLDLLLSLINLFKGFVVAAGRMLYMLLLFGFTFMRADTSPLPRESEHVDPATAAFNSLLKLELLFNHPALWTFARLLIADMKKSRDLAKRCKEEAKLAAAAATAAAATAATGSGTPRSPAGGNVAPRGMELLPLASPGGGGHPRYSASAEGASQRVAAAHVSPLPSLTRCLLSASARDAQPDLPAGWALQGITPSSLFAPALQQAALARDSSIPMLGAAAVEWPLLPLAQRDVLPASVRLPAEARAVVHRRRVLRNRWYLYAMLTLNPSLRAYRRTDARADHVDESMLGAVGKRVTAGVLHAVGKATKRLRVGTERAAPVAGR